MAVGNGDFVSAFAKCIKVEVALLAHLCDISIIRKELNKLLSLRFSCFNKFSGLVLVSGDQFGLDLIL